MAAEVHGQLPPAKAQMLQTLRSLVSDARGAAAIDYSLIVAIVAVAGISAMRAIGVKSADVMNAIATTLT